MTIINKMIRFLESTISFILSFFWVPWFISPPDDTPVDYLTTDGYILAGNYKNGTYQMYPEKRDPKDTYGWRLRGRISFPKVKVAGRSYNTTFLFSPKSDHVWEYVDPAGQKHHVTYNTYKQMSESPMSTTLSDKRKKLEKQTEKAREQKAQNVAKIKGNSL